MFGVESLDLRVTASLRLSIPLVGVLKVIKKNPLSLGPGLPHFEANPFLLSQ